MATRERGAMEIKAMEEGEEDSRVQVGVVLASSGLREADKGMR